MRRHFTAALAVLTLACFAGCGGSETAAPAAGKSGNVPTDPIALVVHNFFDAVRQGRTAEANQCLTPLALERNTALNRNIAPPGSPTASFQVGGVTKRENDHALVGLVWTDVDAAGKAYKESIFCELRMCEGQWRICGMAQDLGPGQPPMVMDFESAEGVAQQPATKAAPAPESAATAAPVAPKQIAQDPFQQPVQR